MDVPPLILDQVERHIGRIKRVNATITQLRQLEKRFGSPGRYEWEYRTGPNFPDVRASVMFFEKFEALAREKGIDPEAVYQPFGGKPAPEPWSYEALDWVQ